ncbi:hypothetical protein OSB04_001586 [Centaurea solstitialis]|uniref:Retrotransposon gag domain-containing protein n=1 Tax=Centaurea solstitialis TaxID=347529 RepID=A0AA38TRA9_9ASTR|nr:hypothetical protein OSB04_001586 [Centaurea solstitialis]
MSYDIEQPAITEFRLQITSMLFLSSAKSSTLLMEVFTSVDRISRLQNRLGSEGSETPDLRDLIGSEVNEMLQQLLPGLFAQMRDELLIDAAFTAHGSGTGSTSQGRGRTSTFKDFMACQPPHFEGRKDPISCFRWVASIEGAFCTSGCPEGMEVFYAVNLLRNAGKDWWGLILNSRTKEQISAMSWDEFKVLLDE